MVTHDLTRPGLILIGDAAGFTLNTGLTIRGMDLAAGSALAAVKAINRALNAADFSRAAMDVYLAELNQTFVGQDMKTYAKAPALLEVERMYSDYGPLLADVLYGLFNHDLSPRKHALTVARQALKKSDIKILDLAKDGLLGVRAL